FAPADNRRLANLCGALDENLRQIETALEVVIARRGERFALTGRPDRTRLAAQALETFYARTKRSLSVEEVQLGLIEVMRARPSAGVEDTPQLKTRRQDLRGRTPRQVLYLKQIHGHDITFSIGPAGTGKTYLAVACAIDALERDQVKRIVLVRPAVEAGERLGFLPGDMAQKVDPYLRPLLAFMRGRTLNHSFVILDEAQNTTPEQMKMFLTRIGFGSKAVVTGDITQIDLPRGHKSGLIEARAVLKRVRGIAFTHFLSSDVVRHPLVQRIVNAYERHTRTQAEPGA
ncbi:MAG: PhoH family protein, partial [Betaproteobacteria bacterium]|nr:PhoH family protein [Betaproteobacteria bacterium]